MEFEKRKLEWLDFEALEKYSHVLGRVYLRHGGVSQSHFTSLNVGLAVGDHPDSVHLNREIIKKSSNVSKVLFMNQVHQTKIVEVNAATKEIPNCDGLFTKDKNIALAVCHADCQAAIFFDPKIQAIAALHVGWKGLVKNFYKIGVEFFQKHGSRPEDIVVCISPSLGPCHSEFKNYHEEIPKEYWSYRDDKSHFNLWNIARDQLINAGILKNNLEIAEVCTFCHKDEYYSYRREKETGRHATIIAFKS